MLTVCIRNAFFDQPCWKTIFLSSIGNITRLLSCKEAIKDYAVNDEKVMYYWSVLYRNWYFSRFCDISVSFLHFAVYSNLFSHLKICNVELFCFIVLFKEGTGICLSQHICHKSWLALTQSTSGLLTISDDPAVLVRIWTPCTKHLFIARSLLPAYNFIDCIFSSQDRQTRSQ